VPERDPVTGRINIKNSSGNVFAEVSAVTIIEK
jgi:hypothetical protein